jgi:hypothetical protein
MPCVSMIPYSWLRIESGWFIKGCSREAEGVIMTRRTSGTNLDLELLLTLTSQLDESFSSSELLGRLEFTCDFAIPVPLEASFRELDDIPC